MKCTETGWIGSAKRTTLDRGDSQIGATNTPVENTIEKEEA